MCTCDNANSYHRWYVDEQKKKADPRIHMVFKKNLVTGQLYMFFISFGASIQGFGYCQHFIALDETYLNGKFGIIFRLRWEQMDIHINLHPLLKLHYMLYQISYWSFIRLLNIYDSLMSHIPDWYSFSFSICQVIGIFRMTYSIVFGKTKAN